MWGDIAIAFILAFVVTFVTTPYMIKIAKKIGAVDIPKDERRAHKKAIPKFGGPAVILGFLISTIYLLIVMSMEHTINLFDFQQLFSYCYIPALFSSQTDFPVLLIAFLYAICG